MKKKKIKSKRKSRSSVNDQKIDVILASLLNLELQVKQLIKKIDQLQYSQPYYPKDNNPDPKWPSNAPYRYDGVTWFDKGVR